MMKTKFFNIELEMVQDLQNPPYPLEKNDKVVGSLDDELKKLYTLWRQKVRESRMLMLDSEQNPEENTPKAIKTQAEAEILESIFWYECRAAFNSWEANRSIGVRKDWVVVTCEENSPQNFLKKLLGGE